MARSHAELEQMLDAVDAAIPRLVEAKPRAEDFWTAFASMANKVQACAGPDDHGWVCDRLDAIQVKHHLVPPADQI
ncbi:hypothetical protein DVT68_00810 [Dyella solisilvae]|uniref:Uncharacterized protein n=1 Tax=Dyella solisilvae TaxID=1920168 RepID=A0A370K9V3_9GAMM|nr:hypothetical protein [Dyella solisilvae]RDI99436.1 hypothetical protein DVT68_00810 [Dyella solisilvae]